VFPIIRTSCAVSTATFCASALVSCYSVTAALSAAIWLAQSLRLIDLIVNRGLVDRHFPLPGIADLAAFSRHRAADWRVHCRVFTFNRLTSESELVAMRSVG